MGRRCTCRFVYQPLPTLSPPGDQPTPPAWLFLRQRGGAIMNLMNLMHRSSACNEKKDLICSTGSMFYSPRCLRFRYFGVSWVDWDLKGAQASGEHAIQRTNSGTDDDRSADPLFHVVVVRACVNSLYKDPVCYRPACLIFPLIVSSSTSRRCLHACLRWLWGSTTDVIQDVRSFYSLCAGGSFME